MAEEKDTQKMSTEDNVYRYNVQGNKTSGKTRADKMSIPKMSMTKHLQIYDC